MRRILAATAVLTLASGVAFAGFCERDNRPAATLLVPYAVVTMNGSVPDPAGYTTLLTVTNLSNAKQIIHVVVWNARSEHVAEFDEVLSGYDVWTINFRDLLTGSFNLFDTGDGDGIDNGSGPRPYANPPQPQIGDFWAGTTGTSGYTFGPDSTDGYSGYAVKLPEPQDVDYPTPAMENCTYPYGSQPGMGAAIVTALQAAIQPLGQDLTTDGCDSFQAPSPQYLTDLTPNPLFFYVTVDVVSGCTRSFPDEATYWSPAPSASVNNVLVGDIVYLNQSANFSESVPAVAIEADLDWASAVHHGFYSRYSEAAVVHDFHEPLGTAFAFRYLNSGGVTSEVMVWKNQVDIVNVGGVDFANACRPYVYYAFDENENAKERGYEAMSAEPNVLPYATQKVPLDLNNWNGLLPNGWVLLVFDPSIPLHGPFDDPAAGVQAWVGVQYVYQGYSTALEAPTLGNVWCHPTDVLPALNTYLGAADGHLGGPGAALAEFGHASSLPQELAELTSQMREAAEREEFELAAALRDRIHDLLRRGTAGP